MAELKAEVVKISHIKEHPNADRMELAFVYGYQVCVQKGLYNEGALAIYIPVDSILTERLEALIFGPDSKVKLNKHRVRAIKLRGAVSQGMIIPLELASQYPGGSAIQSVAQEGMDCTSALDITKYQPPVKTPNALSGGNQKKAQAHNNPAFRKYTSINHLRKYINGLGDGERIFITEKIHGTNFRAGWVPTVANTFLKKLKKIFGRLPKWEFVYGSHNVQLQQKGKGKAFCDNVYAEVVRQHQLKMKIKKGFVWYGEIFGDGIQKNYSYGFKSGKVDVAFMDVWDVTKERYEDFAGVMLHVESVREQVVPWTEGYYNLDAILDMLNDPELTSRVDLKTKPVEGFVVRPAEERDFYGGRLILKVLSDEYLLQKDGTDWH